MRINDVNICIKIVNCSLDEIPDTVKGKVVYVNVGEYNPVGWFHDIIVNKKDMIYTPKSKSSTYVDLSALMS